jgi:hypothetical protein
LLRFFLLFDKPIADVEADRMGDKWGRCGILLRFSIRACLMTGLSGRHMPRLFRAGIRGLSADWIPEWGSLKLPGKAPEKASG